MATYSSVDLLLSFCVICQNNESKFACQTLTINVVQREIFTVEIWEGGVSHDSSLRICLHTYVVTSCGTRTHVLLE